MEIRRIAEDDDDGDRRLVPAAGSAGLWRCPAIPGPCRTFHGAASDRCRGPTSRSGRISATVDDQPVGFYCRATVHHLGQRDVLGVSWRCTPDRRRAGLWQCPARRRWARWPEKLGCTRLLTEMPMDGRERPWARSRGARPVCEMMHRRLDLSRPSTTAPRRACSPTRGRTPRATRSLQWTSPMPDEHLADCAVLEGKMSTDMPLDDLAWEPEVYDAERCAGGSQTIAARGMRPVHLCGRHDATGELVGMTTLDPAGHAARPRRPVGDDRARGASRSPARHAAQDREPALRAARAAPAALHRHGERRLERSRCCG